MDVLFMLVLMLLIVSLPLILSLLLFRWAGKSKYEKPLRVLAFMPLGVLAYFIYDAVNPNDAFYKEDFQEATGLRFPDHAEIISKSASYPDTHGDYMSAAAVKISSKEFITLLDKIKNSEFEEKPFVVNFKELERVQHDIWVTKFKKQYVREIEDKVFMIGFLDDNTIIFCRVSW